MAEVKGVVEAFNREPPKEKMILLRQVHTEEL